MVRFAMDSRITVEPLIKDALRQGHWMVDLSTSDTARGLNLREEDNLFMRDKSNLYSLGSVLCVQLILLVSRIPFTTV